MEQTKTLLDPNISAGTTKKYSLPLSHFEYDFIDKCSDVKLLEKIYRVLKSGDEGCFPHLEIFCEEKIAKLNPKSRVLRKDNPLWTKGDLDKDEREQLDEDFKTWTSDIQNVELNIKAATSVETFDPESTELPPIRSGTITLTKDGATTSKPTQSSTKKKAMPREYRDWDKIDIDKELEKVDNDDKKIKEKTIVGNREVKNIPDQIDAKGLSESERLLKANREKDKGNEAFRSNDFKEAIIYYSRSISLMPTAASYNNRALGHLKTEDWQNALKDTNTVLKMEPENVKALLRRGTAYKGLKKFDQARQDLNKVLAFEPKNKKAQELLKEVNESDDKEKERRRTKGTRMKIEDVDELEAHDSKPILETLDEKTEKPVVNGVESANAAKKEVIERKEPVSPEPVVRKAPRRMQIVETESDDEEDDDKEELGEAANDDDEMLSNEEDGAAANGHVSEAEKLAALSKGVLEEKLESKFVPESEKAESDEESKYSDADSESSNSESEADGKDVSAENETVTLDDTKTAEREKSEEKPEKIEQTAEETEVHEGVNAEEEAEHLKRPVFYMRELPANCLKLKEEATNHFKVGQYGEACSIYTKIIAILEKEQDQTVNLSVMYSNRAACQLKIGDLPGTIKDCTQSLQLVPHSVKPLMRRATAYEHSERYRQAYIDYRHVLILDMRMDQAHLGTKRCQHHLQEKDGRKWREKFQMTQVSVFEIPEIIGLDGKPIAQVSYVSNQSTSQSISNNESVSQSNATNESASQSGTTYQPANQSTVTSSPSNQSSVSGSTANMESVPKSESKTKVEEKPKPVKAEPVKQTPQQKFEARKAEGNEFVKKGNFREAVQCYSECIQLQPGQVVSFTNRALCYLRLNQPENAVKDCNEALDLEKNNIKALFRRAQARKMLKEYKDGVQDLNTLLKLDPNNSAAKSEMELMKKYWGEQLNAMKNNIGKLEKEKEKLTDVIQERQRRSVKIQEVDSDESDDISKGSSKAVNKQPTSRTETATSKKDSRHGSLETKESSSVKKDTVKPPGSGGKTTSTPGSKKAKIRETSTGLPQTPKSAPKLEKATPYEFISAWNALKKADSVKPYYELLKQIKPSDLPSMISNKIDGAMLNNITKCVSEFYMKNGELDESYLILQNLSKVARFKTVAMFMSQADKSEVDSILKRLEEQKSGVYSPEDVRRLKNDYLS